MTYGASENGFGGITEHLTPLAETKRVLPRQLCVALGGAALISAFLYLGLRMPSLFPLFMLLAAGAGFLVWFLWRFTQVEYEYLIAEGEMAFSVIYGKKSRRDIFSFSVKEAESILSYAEDRTACDAFPADETRFYASRLDDPDTLCALIRREDGRKIRLFFQGTPAAVAALRRANRPAVKVKESARPEKTPEEK